MTEIEKKLDMLCNLIPVLSKDGYYLAATKIFDAEIRAEYAKTREQEHRSDLDSMGLEGLLLNARAYNALQNDGINTVSKLLEQTEADLLRMPNMGRHSVGVIKNALLSHGLRLGDKR